MSQPPGAMRGGPGRPAGPRPGLRQAFTALHERHYRYLWISSAASFLGLNMQIVARGLLAWELTHSFGAVGTISLAFALPLATLLYLGVCSAANLAIAAPSTSGGMPPHRP